MIVGHCRAARRSRGTRLVGGGWDRWWRVGVKREYIPAGIDSGTQPKAIAGDAQKLARSLQGSSIDGPTTPNGGKVDVVTRAGSFALTLASSYMPKAPPCLQNP